MADAEKKKERILVVGGITDDSQIGDFVNEIMEKMFPDLKPTVEDLRQRAARQLNAAAHKNKAEG